MPVPVRAPIILAVDDDPDQLVLLENLLRQAGYQVRLARTGKEGLKLYKSVSPSLVLLDLHLPDLDGFTLTRRMKRDAAGFVPVVLLTGHGDPEAKRNGVDAGADEFLQKPVSPFELRLRVQSLLRIKALTDELSAQNQRLQELAHTDALCGIPNRRHVLDQLRREARRADRYGTALAVLLFDLDHFKQVNDSYGHATGDAVLRAAAQALVAGIRHEDTVGRFGGEEFLVVAPHIGLEEVVLMANRLRERITSDAPPVAEGQILVTASVGVAAAAPGLPRTPTDLLGEADQALYAAKDAGRNRVAVATPGSDASRHMQLTPSRLER